MRVRSDRDRLQLAWPSVKEKKGKRKEEQGERARRPGQQTYVTRVINCASGSSTCTSGRVISITRLVPVPPGSCCFNSFFFLCSLLASKLWGGGSILPLASGTASTGYRSDSTGTLPAEGGSFHPFGPIWFEVAQVVQKF